MGVPPMWHVTKGHVAEERGGLSQPEVYSFSGGYLMRSRRSFLVTFTSTLFFLSLPAAPASRHLRFTGIYSSRDRLV